MSDTLSILRKKTQKASSLKSEQATNAARLQVPVDSQHKYGAGINKQHVPTKDTGKLDKETEELRHEKVPLDLGKLIMQGRQAKGLSQKDLAAKIFERSQIVNDYEAGRGIPNNIVLGKIERVIGIKLRGKERGQPLLTPEGKKY